MNPPSFGSGSTLAESATFLRNPADRHRRILDVAERNSVIEGLPAFSRPTRAKIAAELRRLRNPAPASRPRE